jgi:hypothetical protein
MSPRIKSCYISAPAGTNLKVLRRALDKRGIRVSVPSEIALGANWSSEITALLSEVDLFIGVLTPERRSDWVLFELGQAYAAKRQVLLLAPSKGIAYFPLDAKEVLTVRASPSNREAIEFALDQLLAAPEPKVLAESRPIPGEGLGTRTDEFIREMTDAISESKPIELEKIIGRALRESGVETLATEFKDDRRVDIAVWSDALQRSVGNPLLIEIKMRLGDRQGAHQAASQLSKQIASSGTRWGLLLYGAGPSWESLQQGLPPNVLAIALADLFEKMRHRPFPEVVSDLRNRRVHGIAD